MNNENADGRGLFSYPRTLLLVLSGVLHLIDRLYFTDTAVQNKNHAGVASHEAEG